jgi:hypothetical protein
MSALDWRGEQILARAAEASRAAIDETTAACVPLGQARVHVLTGLLRSRIASVPAEVRGDEVVGAYGVPDDPGYALPQELLPGPQGKPYIRPAADIEYPQLAGRIAGRLAR